MDENNAKMNLGEALNYKAQSAQIASGDRWYRDRFFEILNASFDECKEICIQKNSDYTRLFINDPLHNFRSSEIDQFLILNNIKHVDSITLDILHEMERKRSRILNLLLTGEQKVLDESIEDTLRDNANFSLLLLSHLRLNYPRVSKPKSPSELKQESYLEHELNDARTDIQRYGRQLDSLRETVSQLVNENERLLSLVPKDNEVGKGSPKTEPVKVKARRK